MHTYARRSLLSVIVTAVLITVNHLYPLGTRALGLGAVLVLAPAGLLWWFRTTRSRVAFAGYLLMNLWIVVGFGFVKGLWTSTLPVFLGSLLASVSTSFPRPTLGPVPLELSGILTFIGSLFVLYYGYRLVRANHDAAAGAESEKPTAGRPALLAASALVALAVIAGAYAFTDQDRWIAPANGVVKIGVIVPASGPYAILGNSFLKAVEMARSDLRGTKYRYELARVGLAITYAQEFADSVTDFRSMIAQARASNPDVYFVEALSPQLELLGQQLFEVKIRNIASVVAPSVTQRPELFEGAWYTDSDLRDIGFKQRFEDQYPGTRFATHMMPYAYDDFNMIVQAFEREENPAVYIRNIASYDGTAGPLTKAPGSGNFQSRPAVWVIRNGKPALLSLQ